MATLIHVQPLRCKMTYKKQFDPGTLQKEGFRGSYILFYKDELLLLRSTM